MEGRRNKKLLAAVAAYKVALAKSGLQSSAHGRQHIVAATAFVGVVDLLEMIEVEQEQCEWRDGARCLGRHALKRVLDGAAVRQARERVGRRAKLCQCETAEVREHRRCLPDRR